MKIHFTQKQMVYVIKDLLSLPQSGSWMYRTVGKILTFQIPEEYDREEVRKEIHTWLEGIENAKS